MRRTGILLALALTLAGAAIYLGTRGGAKEPAGGSPVGRPTATAVGLVLTAQESPAQEGAKRDWMTTRRLSLTCGSPPAAARSAGAPSDRALCDAVAYYSKHVPTQPCIVRGVILKYRRVVITGSLDGHPLHLAMGLVCNPPPALSRAVQTIYIAAFG